jgi:hypothetical protein
MRGDAQFLVGGLGVALVLLSAMIGLELSVTTARSGGESSWETVNRTQKGDRLPLVPAFHRNAVNQLLEIKVPRAPNTDSELADGCESLVSSLAHSPWANVAGRCVS